MNTQAHMTQLIVVIFSLVLYSTSCSNDNRRNEQEKFNKIDSLFTGVFEDNQPGGSILVLTHGEVFYRNAVGLENINTKIKLSPEKHARVQK